MIKDLLETSNFNHCRIEIYSTQDDRFLAELHVNGVPKKSEDVDTIEEARRLSAEWLGSIGELNG